MNRWWTIHDILALIKRFIFSLKLVTNGCPGYRGALSFDVVALSQCARFHWQKRKNSYRDVPRTFEKMKTETDSSFYVWIGCGVRMIEKIKLKTSFWYKKRRQTKKKGNENETKYWNFMIEWKCACRHRADEADEWHGAQSQSLSAINIGYMNWYRAWAAIWRSPADKDLSIFIFCAEKVLRTIAHVAAEVKIRIGISHRRSCTT